jgi:HK97 gp10 family phage protein
MTISIDVSQVTRLAGRLVRDAALTKARVEHSVDGVAQEVLADMQANVPVLTGALRASLGIERVGRAFRVGSLHGEAADRAHFSEYGTSDTAPDPFVGPAADRSVPKLSRAVSDAVV